MVKQWFDRCIAAARSRLDGLRAVEVGVREAAQSLVEYAIGVAVIAIVALGAVQAFGGGVGALFTRLLNRVAGIG